MNRENLERVSCPRNGGPVYPALHAPPPLRRAVAESTNGSSSATVPEPVVKIDNERDPFATVVTIEYGDRLGELLDTVGAATGGAAGQRSVARPHVRRPALLAGCVMVAP